MTEPGWYAQGGYITSDGPEMPDALLPRLNNDYVINAADAARIGLDYIKRMYGKPEEETP